MLQVLWSCSHLRGRGEGGERRERGEEGEGKGGEGRGGREGGGREGDEKNR